MYQTSVFICKVKLAVCLTKYVALKTYALIKGHAMKMYGGVELWYHVLLTNALNEDEWSASPQLVS
jgi:hypothetical protein